MLHWVIQLVSLEECIYVFLAGHDIIDTTNPSEQTLATALKRGRMVLATTSRTTPPSAEIHLPTSSLTWVIYPSLAPQIPRSLEPFTVAPAEGPFLAAPRPHLPQDIGRRSSGGSLCVHRRLRTHGRGESQSPQEAA